MKIYIKNMYCNHCKMALKAELKKLKIPYDRIDLGVVEASQEISEGKLELLSNNLLQIGLEIIRNTKDIVAENIANAIIELVHYSDELKKLNLEDFLQKKLKFEYSYLANVFSEVKGISIEKFFTTHRIERVKELLINDDLDFSEISVLTNYSSVSHLSDQFKKATGLSLAFYRQLYSRGSILINSSEQQLPFSLNNTPVSLNNTLY